MPCEAGHSGALSPFLSWGQQTHPSFTASSTTLLYDDIYMVDMSAEESVSNIRSLIHSPSWIAVARSLRGEEAQGLIDFIDQASGAQLQCHDALWYRGS